MNSDTNNSNSRQFYDAQRRGEPSDIETLRMVGRGREAVFSGVQNNLGLSVSYMEQREQNSGATRDAIDHNFRDRGEDYRNSAASHAAAVGIHQFSEVETAPKAAASTDLARIAQDFARPAGETLDEFLRAA